MAVEDYYYPLFTSRPKRTTDSVGDTIVDYGDEREITGAVTSVSGSQATIYAQRGIDAQAVLVCPCDAGVIEFDLVRDTFTGKRYQVVSEPKDNAKQGHHVTAALQRWKGAL